MTRNAHLWSWSESILCIGGPGVIRKEAWPFYRTISAVRLCWELEEPKGPKGAHGASFHRNVQRFRGGLVFKANRLLYHSTPGLKEIKRERGGVPLDRVNSSRRTRERLVQYFIAQQPAPAPHPAHPVGRAALRPSEFFSPHQILMRFSPFVFFWRYFEVVEF